MISLTYDVKPVNRKFCCVSVFYYIKDDIHYLIFYDIILYERNDFAKIFKNIARFESNFVKLAKFYYV